MSIPATNWVWGLEDLPNATVKLVLMKYADHAHDDGTHTWQSIGKVAKYALCSERTAQRAVAWLVEHGFMREGDQSVIPSHYDPRRRPIAYELAMNEDRRLQWEVQNATGPSTRRDAAVAAGRKGAATRTASTDVQDGPQQPAWGDNPSPQRVRSTPDAGGDNLSPQESDARGDNQVAYGVTDSPLRGDTGVTQTTLETTLTTTPSSATPAVPNETGSPNGSPKKRGTRLPSDFEVTPAMVEWARRETPDVDGRVETKKFIDYWTAKPGKDGVKLDWPATWRNWFRSAQQRLDQRRTERGTAYRDADVWGRRPDSTGTPMSDEEADKLFGLAAAPDTTKARDVG